jgi:hypothetical protein
MILIPLLFGAVAPATVQPKSDFSAAETRKILDDYGACVVKAQRARASEAILRNVGNGELMRRYPQLIKGECLPRQGWAALQVKFAGDQYRYALADALVRLDLAARPAPVLDAVPLLDHRAPGDPPSKLSPKGKPLKPAQYEAALRAYERAKGFNFVSRFGECVVRLNPAAARALLLTRPETPEERAAFAPMGTAFGTCMPEGVTVSFSKVVIRGTVALNYYRLAQAAQGAPVPGAAK